MKGMPISRPMTTDQVTTWSLNKAKFSGIIGLLWAYCTVSKCQATIDIVCHRLPSFRDGQWSSFSHHVVRWSGGQWSPFKLPQDESEFRRVTYWLHGFSHRKNDDYRPLKFNDDLQHPLTSNSKTFKALPDPGKLETLFKDFQGRVATQN